MPITTDAARSARRERARERHAERMLDPLYVEAKRQRDKNRRDDRNRRRAERYATDRAYQIAEDKRRAARRTIKRRIIQDERPFVGCDGEGVGRGADSRYALFRMGERELGPFDGDRALTTPELLKFITQAPAEPIYVGFAFTYDISNILRHVPHVREGNKKSRLDRVMQRDKAGLAHERNNFGNARWTWLDFDGYPTFGVSWLPRNHLSVCLAERSATGLARPVPKSERTIYDVFGNFQSSFVNALEKWDFGVRHRETIERMKRQRDTFITITPQIRAYCELECRLLGELMEDFRRVCLDNDLRPRTWNGAGKIATALHKQNETITAKQLFGYVDREGVKHAGLIPPAVRKFAHAAYYGGRFEVTRVGKIAEPVFEHDIASAYPAKMLELPCLLHGEWQRADAGMLATLKADQLFVADVRFSHPKRQFLCGLPIRSQDGSLSWPLQGQGIYWGCEIFSARRLGAKITFSHGWRYITRCTCKMFRWVDRLYKVRQQIGKGRKGIPIKLGINSLYGKMAQRVGNPTYANPIWAGLITALTRSQINTAIAKRPRDVVMIATDGVYTIGRVLPLKIGDNLGDWELKTYPSLFVVQPGLYWPPKPADTSERRVKSRGVSASAFEPYIEQFERSWAAFMRWTALPGRTAERPSIEMLLTLFIGLRLAYHRDRVDSACQWIIHPHTTKFDWVNKRDAMTRSADGHAGVLSPLQGSPQLRSIVYTDNEPEHEQPQLIARMLIEALPDGGAEFAPPSWG